MSVNIDELHEVIDDIFADINQNSSEALFRFYISRSYYAVFHELRLAMKRASIDIEQYQTGTHRNLCFILDDLSKQNPKIRQIAFKFSDFLDKRHKADYDLNNKVSWFDVQMAQNYKAKLPILIKENIK